MHDGQQLVEAVDGVEQVALVLAQVGVVGERQAVEHAEEAAEVGGQPRSGGPHQLGGVRVLLLRHDARAAGVGVRQAHEAELGGRPEDELGAEPRDVRAQLRRGGEVVDDEVAVGHRVERVLGDALEAEVGRLGLAVELEVEADGGAGAERELEAGLPGGLEPRAVALEHPEVRQQVLRQRGDLGALQVRVRGQHRLDVVGRASDEQLLERGERRVLAFGHAAQVQAHVRDHLVVAAAAGVQPGAGVADELGQPALDGHVHVLVGVGRDEGAGLDLAADGGEAGLDGLELGRAQDAGAPQRPRVRDGALDVLGPEAPVERQRAVQRHERGRALAGEAA